MADPELLKILSQGVAAWNRWWKANASEAGFDLTNANLESADLNEATFTFANLAGATLSNAQLRKSAFHFANLSGAKLNGAYLEWAGFSFARLERANLKGARLDGAFIKGADLTEANLEGVGFAEANLSRSTLHRAKLADADFIDARLFGTRFWQTDLRRVKLHGAFLYGVNLNNCDLTDAEVGFTTFSNCAMGEVIGLHTVKHQNPSSIGIDTIFHSKNKIPKEFLRGCGLPEAFITQIPALITSIEPLQFYSCFISYSSKDQSFAEQLYADLENKGVRCWFAPEDLKIGDKFRDRIDESIRLHDKLLLILSESSVASPWVSDEVEAAIEREHREGRTVLFPIKIDEAVIESEQAWAAAIRRTRHIGDFTDWKNHDSYQKAFDRLLRDLKADEKNPKH
jgi:uncharacterized protein YjbI with pentapeptide repeats